MKSPAFILFALGISYLAIGEEVVLELKSPGSHSELSIHSRLNLPISGSYSEYTVLWSTNLQSWSPIVGPVAGAIGTSDERLRVAVPTPGLNGFFQVMARTKLAPEGNHGDSVYGYSTEFSRELQVIGQLPLRAFLTRYSLTNRFVGQISFDPTTAEYWEAFNLDPAVHNATNSTDPRLTDFRLNTNELAIFKTNGFVVSRRLGSYSFTDQFYRIYTDDLPVFFSCDAALNAWHKSYSAMLEELEEVYLRQRVLSVLGQLSGRIATLSSESIGTALADAVTDVDMFLAVGGSLLSGTTNYGALGQNDRILAMLSAVNNLQPAEINLFGAKRVVDFSQFQVRGHYDTSERLRRYFRGMMWLGLVDFRFAGETNDNSLRELSGAIALSLLMTRSGALSTWLELDRVLQALVGVPDSLNFPQLGDLLAAASIQKPADLPNQAALQAFQNKLMSGQIGVQDIRSGYFFSPLTRELLKLPRSFAVVGQRFVLDGWALSKCVFDDIIWDSDGIPGFEDKVMRRVPSALDVAFSVLGNNHAVPWLAYRMGNTNGHRWRDGYPYQHNLVAVRNVVEAQDPAVWNRNIYNLWLGCLRELSEPTTSAEYPEAMRTRAWGLKSLNTQLGSWTELKHDTVLYAKQPYTSQILCLYPDAYVEPRVGFWKAMETMARTTQLMLANLPTTGQFGFEPNIPGDTWFTNSLLDIHNFRQGFLQGFADSMVKLAGISEKELSRTPLSLLETLYLQDLVEYHGTYVGVRMYSGWYPGLFFKNSRARRSVIEPSDHRQQVVTDVHSDPPEPLVGDTGSILHEGVGNMLLLMIAIDCAPGERTVYAGPVYSHYEFEQGPGIRKTDNQWIFEVQTGNLPPQPDWTRTYQAP